MIALRRVDVADLNGRARALMRASGALGDTELVLDGRAFAIGDRVQLRRNDRRLGVANGDRGTVTARRPGARHGSRWPWPAAACASTRTTSSARPRGGPPLAHGYAITGHSAQGLTCDETFVLVSGEASREWVYTALSRGRTANRLYAIAPEPDERDEIAPAGERAPTAREALRAAVGRSSAQTLASERASSPALPPASSARPRPGGRRT